MDSRVGLAKRVTVGYLSTTLGQKVKSKIDNQQVRIYLKDPEQPKIFHGILQRKLPKFCIQVFSCEFSP